MAEEGKLNTDRQYPVILTQDTDRVTPASGVPFGDVTVEYSGEGDSSTTSYTIDATNWTEAGSGQYWLKMGEAEFTAEQKFEVTVQASGVVNYNFAVEVREQTVAEMLDEMTRLNTQVEMGATYKNASDDFVIAAAATRGGQNIGCVGASGYLKKYDGTEVFNIALSETADQSWYAVKNAPGIESNELYYLQVQITPSGGQLLDKTTRFINSVSASGIA